MCPSRIQGVGVFATRDFRPAERIHEVREAQTLPEADLPHPDPEAPYRYDYYPDRTIALEHPDGLFNHSCDPNAYDWWAPDGRRWKVARRAFAAGEEITGDYCVNSWGGTVWQCACGTARCRREIHSSYFALPEVLQVEYLPLLARWFVEAFRAEVEALCRRRGLPLVW